MKRKITNRDPATAQQVAWIVLAMIVLGLVIAIRIRLMGMPLERDEGEYAYAGQLLLQGIPPYKLAYNMKFPGTYAAYALMMSVFGQTISGIHLGFLLVNLATITLIFVLGRRLVNATTGIVAAVTYAVLSVSPTVFGLAAHATNFVMLPVLGGTLLLLNHPRTDGLPARRSLGAGGGSPESFRGCEAVTSCFASGILFGISLLMKQPAVFFIFFGAGYLLFEDVRRQLPLTRIALRILTFSFGAILPFLITCLLLWRAGVFAKFWFWTIDYARQYASVIPMREAPKIFAEGFAKVIGFGWLLWLLSGIGLVAGLWNKQTRASTVFLIGLLVCSALALWSGFYFREHYFILVLPAVSLFAGLAISRLSDALSNRATLARFTPLILLAVALSLPIFASRKFFFEASPIEASRMIYGLNPFPESIRIAEYVRDHTNPGDTIAVLGSEPEIYFYSNRHSATGYIYTYELMEAQGYARQMQEEMIREIELAQPKYLLSVEISTSWLRRPESERLIFTWANEYIKKHYYVVGLVNIIAPNRTDYYFGDLPKSPPQLGSYILVCQRKS